MPGQLHPAAGRLAGSREAGAALARLVPGGAHTYAKGDDQYPQGMAPVLVRGKGCRVEDVDGNEYVEWGMGLRAVTLGHGHPAVVEAVCAAAAAGTNFVRPSLLELEAAQALLSAVPGEMVKFTKDGSTANTAALRLARAATGREFVAVCADQPFFSYDDWFIGTTAMGAGIPASASSETLRFPYGDLEAIAALFAEHPGQIACVMLEPERTEPAPAGYLAGLAELTRREGAVLVFDENVTGFRWHLGGAQSLAGVTPDLATFGKAMANGVACSALVGRSELMSLGSQHGEHERVFLLSTTHGAEHLGLAAAVATIDTYRREQVVETLWRQGARLRRQADEAIRARGLDQHVQLVGRDPCLFYVTRDATGSPSQAFRTLFLQETIARGVLAPSLVVSAAHDDDAIDHTVEAIDGALAVYVQALDQGVERHLHGRPVRPVMQVRACPQ